MQGGRKAEGNLPVIVALVAVTKVETAQTSISSEWINKTGSIHTMEYYSAIKRNEALRHAPAWMSPGNMLSERCQSEKAT